MSAKIALYLLSLSVLLFSCAQSSGNQISVEEVIGAKIPEATLVDCRTQSEIEIEGYIKGAKFIDYRSEQSEALIVALSEEIEGPVIVYCASGGRSQKVADRLTELGVEEVYNMDGGFNEWKNQKGPIKRLE